MQGNLGKSFECSKITRTPAKAKIILNDYDVIIDGKQTTLKKDDYVVEFQNGELYVIPKTEFHNLFLWETYTEGVILPNYSEDANIITPIKIT